MSATVADYPDAVDRITESHVRPSHTTRAEVVAALRSESGPQVTQEVAADLADSILTEERVIEAIDSSGEVPSDSEIQAFVSGSDDYNMSDRQDSVEQAVRDRVATLEEIDRAVESQRPTDRQMYREDVESGVSEVAADKEIRGADPDDIVTGEARERGTPARTDFERARAQSVAQADTVTPADVLDDTSAQTPVSVIRDNSGNAVAATGGPSDDIGSRVAAEIGAEYLSAEEVVDDMRASGTGSTVDLTLRGRAVGEVDVR